MELVRQTLDDVLPEEAATNVPNRGKTPLWRHKSQTSQVDLRAARLEATGKCDRQPVASDHKNQATTTWSVCDELNEGNANVDDGEVDF